MSVIGKRMNHLKDLVHLRNGPGAAILPPNITKIHLEFAHKWDDGHFGPRKFWHEHLRRLKYYNPSIPMIVNRTHDQSGPATLSIYVKGGASRPSLQIAGPTGGDQRPSSSSSSSSAAAGTLSWQQIASSTEGTAKAPPPENGEDVVTIDMKNVRSDVILRLFMAKTGATPVDPTPEDRMEMERLAELKVRADADRVEGKKYRDAIKAEQKMLERARQEAADALKQD